MKKRSKRFSLIKQQTQPVPYAYKDGIYLLKKFANANFEETAEAHISLNIDPKKMAQQIRGTLAFPHGIGKKVKIAVFTSLENIPDMLAAGADYAGSEDLVEKVLSGWTDFDLLLTSPTLMPKLTKLGKVLGSKGLMPSIKSGTITADLIKSIKEFKQGKIEYRADKNGIIHLSFGKVLSNPSQLEENLEFLYKSIQKMKPQGLKGKLIKSFYICSTMGPSFLIETSSF